MAGRQEGHPVRGNTAPVINEGLAWKASDKPGLTHLRHGKTGQLEKSQASVHELQRIGLNHQTAYNVSELPRVTGH